MNWHMQGEERDQEQANKTNRELTYLLKCESKIFCSHEQRLQKTVQLSHFFSIVQVVIT